MCKRHRLALSCGKQLLGFLAALIAPMPLTAQAPKDERVVLASRGHLVPASQITVSPRVAGQVIELLIDEGSQVKAGDVLARLNAEEQKAALRLAQARLTLAEAEMTRANEGAGKGDRAVALAKLDIARAAVALAQYRLDCTIIRAPSDGIVLVKRAEVGMRIDPRAPQLPASLCDLADLRTMDVEVWVQERDLPKIARGQPCLIQVDAVPNTTYRGRVVRLQSVADRARGAVAVRVRLEPPQAHESLRPELSAIVDFLAKERTARE